MRVIYVATKTSFVLWILFFNKNIWFSLNWNALYFYLLTLWNFIVLRTIHLKVLLFNWLRLLDIIIWKWNCLLHTLIVFLIVFVEHCIYISDIFKFVRIRCILNIVKGRVIRCIYLYEFLRLKFFALFFARQILLLILLLYLLLKLF